jgi:hypothetical protein
LCGGIIGGRFPSHSNAAGNSATVRNGVVYYVQIDKTIYQITRSLTKPETFLVAGKKVQCRIEKDKMYLPDEKGKDVRYKILGETSSQ